MIDRFAGSFRWLSNFYPCLIKDRHGIVYPTAEHAFQAAKSRDPLVRIDIAQAPTPGEAKRMGRRIEIREDWEAIKLTVMARILEQKFAHPHLRELLLMTGGQQLIEGNTWGDTFWGVCDGVGQNNLGGLLMGLRTELRRREERENALDRAKRATLAVEDAEMSERDDEYHAANPPPREILATRVWRIGKETLFREGDRYFARLDNRTYHSQHEIPIESARERYKVMTGPRPDGTGQARS